MGPIRTPRSGTESRDDVMTSSLDYLKSSNDETCSKINFNLKSQSQLSISKSDNETDSLSDNVQLDINQLQPAEVNFDHLENSHSKSNSNSKFNFGEFEVSEKEISKISKIIKQEMTSVQQSELHTFSIPLLVDINYAKNWGLLH